MSNNQNLKPFNTLLADRHKELSQKGGIASGAARRAKRERIEREKAVQAANHELFRDSLDVLAECARLLKHTRPNCR